MSRTLIAVRTLVVVVLVAFLVVVLGPKIEFSSVQQKSQWYALRKEYPDEVLRNRVKETVLELFDEQPIDVLNTRNAKDLPPPIVSSQLSGIVMKTALG